MKNRVLLILFVFLFFLSIDNVFAEKTTNCVVSINPTGSSYRVNGHQSQWLGNGSYTVKGSVTGCVSITGYNSSVVNLKVSGTKFYFSPQKTGTTSATYIASASCTCSGTELKKTVTFSLSEWGLSSLSVKGYSLDPKFYNMTKEYSITVPQNVNSVVLNFAPNERNAKLKVNGNSVSSGENVQADIINNKITITVTTSVGRSDTTTINVIRSGSVVPEPESSVMPPSSSSIVKPSSSSKKVSPSSEYIPYSSNDYEEENPDAGSAEMFIIWFLGIAAIGYSVYYFKTLKNMNV